MKLVFLYLSSCFIMINTGLSMVSPPIRMTNQTACDSLTTLKIHGHLVDIHTPAMPVKGNILVLPGWNFSRQDWCRKSSLCKKALEQGYRLIMPEMGKSVYSSTIYPQTRKDWVTYPTKAWIVDHMLPTLQSKYRLLLAKQSNFLVGLSTGGRGVVLLALAKPGLFKAAAALSGDFDQTQMPGDKLMIGYYGTYQQFPKRWEGEDNPVKQVKNFKTPIYLGHGKQDKVVPVAQTQMFYDALIQAHPQLKVQLHLINARHDYSYWDSEVENMLSFLKEFL